MKTFFFLILLSILTLSCVNAKKAGRPVSKQSKIKPQKSRPKTDTKIIEKYGFKYSIPTNWQKTLSDFKVADLQGHIKSIESDYRLPDGKSRIKIIFHPGKSGLVLFNAYHQSKRKNLIHININGIPAVKLTETLKFDGKGHSLPQPVIREKYWLLSPDKKACLEIVADYPTGNQDAVQTINDFIKGIEPVKK